MWNIDKFIKIYFFVVVIFYAIFDSVLIFIFDIPSLTAIIWSLVSFVPLIPFLIFIRFTTKAIQRTGKELRNIRDPNKLNLYIFVLGVVFGIIGNLLASEFFEILHGLEKVIPNLQIGLQTWILMFMSTLFVIIIFLIEIDRYLKEPMAK
jgi:O-antigen/teichoic acid export membrane protein